MIDVTKLGHTDLNMQYVLLFTVMWHMFSHIFHFSDEIIKSSFILKTLYVSVSLTRIAR